jgi:hypothetical protein
MPWPGAAAAAALPLGVCGALEAAALLWAELPEEDAGVRSPGACSAAASLLLLSPDAEPPRPGAGRQVLPFFELTTKLSEAAALLLCSASLPPLLLLPLADPVVAPAAPYAAACGAAVCPIAICAVLAGLPALAQEASTAPAAVPCPLPAHSPAAAAAAACMPPSAVMLASCGCGTGMPSSAATASTTISRPARLYTPASRASASCSRCSRPCSSTKPGRESNYTLTPCSF